MKVRMPPKIPNIPPPQLECGTRTAKNHSVRMPHHPGFKFYIYINVNPGLINHGLLIRGYSSNSHNLILKWYPPN